MLINDLLFYRDDGINELDYLSLSWEGEPEQRKDQTDDDNVQPKHLPNQRSKPTLGIDKKMLSKNYSESLIKLVSKIKNEKNTKNKIAHNSSKSNKDLAAINAQEIPNKKIEIDLEALKVDPKNFDQNPSNISHTDVDCNNFLRFLTVLSFITGLTFCRGEFIHDLRCCQEELEAVSDANIQGAVDHCLHISSSFCLDFILTLLKQHSIEPVVGIRALSATIQNLELHKPDERFQTSFEAKIISSWSRSKDQPDNTIVNESLQILQVLVQKHNCILKYGEEHETITDILKCCYQELGNQHSLCYKSRNHRHNSSEDLLDQSKSQCYDCLDNGDFSVAINDESKLDETLHRFNKHVHSRTQVHDDFIRDAPKVDFSRFKKLNTLRIHKIQQIMEADYKVQGVKLFDLHLLNMKNSQTKYLQPKDAIEVAIIFCLFDGDQIHRLASLVYSWTEQKQSEANSKFPISVYKLMLFYEELDAFHKMFSQETFRVNKVRIVSESLSYSLIISNPMLAIYLANIYPEELFENKRVIIDGILIYLNEFTELNGSTRYRRVRHFEQYLFLIERVLEFFSYSQGKYLINIFDRLLDVGQPSLNTKFPENSRNQQQKRVLDNNQNNFLVYSLTPVKDCVLVMNICCVLQNSHDDLKSFSNPVIKKYSKVVNAIVDETESIQQVYQIFTNKCFNRKEVIDLVSSCDLQLVLNNSKLAKIVEDFWEGPFETEFFMNQSYCYQQLRNMFIDSKRFFGFKPATRYHFSIDKLWSKQKVISWKFLSEIEQQRPRRAHFFHFQRWDKSLWTKYAMEGFMIIISSIIAFIYASEAVDFLANAFRQSQALDKLEELNNSDTPPDDYESERDAILDSMNIVAEQFINSLNSIIFWN